MIKTAPHYLLFTEAKLSSQTNGLGNRWRFVLEEIGTTNRFEEADEEPGIHGERLQLLAVVRGLEALHQPSRVTLITPSKHVGRGIRRSLTQWRENDWQWERFGVMAPVKDHDLWMRIDHAMQIHEINCRIWQFDPPHVRTQVPQQSDQEEMVQSGTKFVSPLATLTSETSARDQKEATSRINRLSSGQASQKTSLRHSHSVPIESHKLDLRQTRPSLGAKLREVSQATGMVEKRVTPIGQGRAYGYAVN